MAPQIVEKKTEEINFPISGDEQHRASPNGTDGSEKLDKVREILFGNDIRSIKQRFAQTEETIDRIASELRAESLANFNLIERELKKLSDEFASLSHELRRDKADKIGLAELLEGIAHRLREDHGRMSH